MKMQICDLTKEQHKLILEDLRVMASDDYVKNGSTPNAVEKWFEHDKSGNNYICFYYKYDEVIKVQFYPESSCSSEFEYLIFKVMHKLYPYVIPNIIDKIKEYESSFCESDVTPYNMSPGRILYKVYVLNSGNTIIKCIIKDYPKLNKYGHLFVTVSYYSDYSDYLNEIIKHEMFLQDMNIIPNKYSKDRAFYSYEKAQQYAKIAKY